jgi:ribosomal protein L29
MNIQLIEEEINGMEALELVTKLIHIKIKYLQNKMNLDNGTKESNEIETKIKKLQKELFQLKKKIESKNQFIKLDAVIKIE